MSETQRISLTLQQLQDYQCRLDFGPGQPPLIADEPPPLGTGQGPSPVQLLLSAVANCLTDSLLFALRKFRQDAEPLRCEAVTQVGRNDRNRLRVLGIEITLQLGRNAAELEHLPRILEQFEDFCTVTQSVAGAIPVRLWVKDAQGSLLKQPAD